MVFKKIYAFDKKVSDLQDKPVEQGAALKAVFDMAPEELRVHLNLLIDALMNNANGDSGSAYLGISEITGVNGLTVQNALQDLKLQLDAVTTGDIKNTILVSNSYSTPYGNTGTLEQFISWLTNRIRLMTGNTNWYDPVPKIVKEATEFLSPVLLNGWIPNSLATYPPRFWKEGSTVHFELAIMNGNMSSNVVIMYFPSGYRPDDAVLFDGHVDGQSSRGIYHVRSDGELKTIRAISTNSLIILNGSFRAVN